MSGIEELLASARRLAKEKNWGREAVAVNTAILEAAPDDVPSLTRRGRCHQELGALGAARRDYELALKLDPGNRIAQNALDKLDGGAALCRKVRVVEKDRLTARNNWKRRQQAERESRESARIWVKRRARRKHILQKLAGLTSFDEASSIAIAAKEASPPDYELAIAAFRKAFMLDRSRKHILVRLAATYRADRQLAKAEKLYDWIVEHEGSFAARTGLAAVYRDMKKPEKACKLYKAVLDYRPDDPFALKGLAGVFSDIGLVEKAVETYEKAGASARKHGEPLDVVWDLERIKEKYIRENQVSKAAWIDSVIHNLRIG